MTRRYNFLEHTADVKFKSFGSNIEEAFENAALALKEVILRGIEIEGRLDRKIIIKGQDKESLLRNFLEEFLYLLEGENFIFKEVKEIKIDLEKWLLEAKVIGDKAENYNINNDVKAVTYNEMFVKNMNNRKNEENKWTCQVVLDV